LTLLSLSDLSHLLRERLHDLHEVDAEDSAFHRTSFESLDDEELKVRRRPSRRSLRDGETWSGPAQFELIDMTGFMLCMSRLPVGSDAMTININVNFLRPPPYGDLIARARPLRRSGRSAVIDISLESALLDEVVTHATASFAFVAANAAARGMAAVTAGGG